MRSEHVLRRRTVHEAAPARALQFLLAANADEAIRRPLRAAGFDRVEYERGWCLLRAVGGDCLEDPPRPEPPAVSADEVARTFYRTKLRCARAALVDLHPYLAREVFADVRSTKRDPWSRVMAFLFWCQELERSNTGHDVLATLARCGVTVQDRANTLRAMQAPGPAAPRPLARSAIDHAAHLSALHRWVQRWCATARSCIERRDLLLRLGIGRRRDGGSERTNARTSASASA